MEKSTKMVLKEAEERIELLYSYFDSSDKLDRNQKLSAKNDLNFIARSLRNTIDLLEEIEQLRKGSHAKL